KVPGFDGAVLPDGDDLFIVRGNSDARGPEVAKPSLPVSCFAPGFRVNNSDKLVAAPADQALAIATPGQCGFAEGRGLERGPLFAGGQVPNVDRPAAVGQGKVLAVGRQPHRRDPATDVLKLLRLTPGGCVPDADDAVRAAGVQALAVGRV